MKIHTYLFGEVDVNPDHVITFPNGLIGFEKSKRFMLAHESGQEDPVSFTLQSVDDPNVAVQIAEPAAVGFHYQLALSDAEAALLKNPAPEDVAVVVVLSKQENSAAGGLGANIRAPIIINTRERLGLQKSIVKARSNITISNLSSAV